VVDYIPLGVNVHQSWGWRIDTKRVADEYAIAHTVVENNE
jgi:hypothetical protein